MKILDVSNHDRINRIPDNVITIFSNGNFKEDGFTIRQIDLRLYIEKFSDDLGPYSIITSVVYADDDTIESVYDEGYRGINALESTAKFLTNALGMASLITRSIISLKHEKSKH